MVAVVTSVSVSVSPPDTEVVSADTGEVSPIVLESSESPVVTTSLSSLVTQSFSFKIKDFKSLKNVALIESLTSSCRSLRVLLSVAIPVSSSGFSSSDIFLPTLIKSSKNFFIFISTAVSVSPQSESLLHILHL